MENQEEEKNQFDVEKALRLPGTIAAIYCVSIVTNLVGYSDLAFSLTTAFSVPFIFIFFVEALFNRALALKTHVIFIGVTSYLFYLSTHYTVLQDGMDAIIHTHITFFVGLASALSIMLLYYSLHRFFPSKDRRTLFFVAFIPAVVIPSIILYVISGQMALAEEEGENVAFMDYWSIWHILTSFAVGLLAYPFIKKFFGEKAKGNVKFGIALGLPILFEVIEQSFLKNILGLTPEFLGNSLVDILVGACAIYIGYELSKIVEIKGLFQKIIKK